MSDDFYFLMSAAAAVSMMLMTVAWLLGRRLDNAGVVDVAWALGFTLVAVVYYLLGVGDESRKLIACGMLALWSLRLGGYLWVRVAGHHPEEDGRYAALREQYPQHTWLMFFGLFQLQALLLVVFSVPFAMAVSNPKVGLSSTEWSGVILWLAAVVGESMADGQLHRFRSQPGNRMRTCMSGMWRWSRHPNYFFEWLVWVAYFLFALGSSDGWITVYCPVLMLFFLLKVSGIPVTETQAQKSRGAEYRDYQSSTSVFVPWFPRKRATARLRDIGP